MFNHNDYYYFVYMHPLSSGSWSFTGYGNKRAIAGLQPDGTENAFVVSFNQKERMYRFRKNQKVIVKDSDTGLKAPTSLYDYLKGHPNCENTSNSNADKAVFKEMDEVKDAGMVIDNKKKRIQSENTALTLAGDGLIEIATLIGVFNSDPTVQQHRVLEFAGQQPDKFMELYNSPDRGIRATIRRAVEAGLLKKMGRVHTWENTVIGADEDDVVSYLTKEEDKFKALKSQVKKLK